MIVHYHTIIVAIARRPVTSINVENLQNHLAELVKTIGMQKLFEPIAIKGKYGFTGIVGIVTSHVAFHYFESDQTLHFDVYSCKEYYLQQLVEFVDRYWDIEDARILFINRDKLERLQHLLYQGKRLSLQ